MPELGRALFIIGLLLAGAGLWVWKVGSGMPLGKLPGDIVIQKGHSTFYFPLLTCLVISIVLTLLLWLFRR